LAGRVNAAWLLPRAMRRANSAFIRRCRSSPRSANAPALIFVPPRFEVYKAVSRQIHAIFAKYTPVIEPLSLDEAYLDVTENLRGTAPATQIAKEIQAEIRAETGLTASAGVSYNKVLAKLASDHRKPDGLLVITPKMGAAFIETLPVGKLHGIGPATTTKMNRAGIYTGRDLRRQSLEFLVRQFGKAGNYYFGIARGIDERPVRADRIRKSIGAENTFAHDLTAFEALRDALQPIIAKVWRHCESSGVRGRTVVLKVKYADFQQITRSRTLAGVVSSGAMLEQVSLELLSSLMPAAKGIRLLGVTLSALETDTANGSQMCLAL
jgi:DNA polymerase-4